MVCIARTQGPIRSGRAIAFSLFLLGSVAALAQSPQDAAAPVFKTSTRAVIVDVVVDNGKGEPVKALHKEDFRIFEDGKPQTIDFFEEHQARTLSGAAAQPLPKMPDGVYTNVPPAPEDDAVNVLLLDSLNTPPQMISYARNQILNYLDHVKPGTRIAIFALNKNLSIVQGFTSDAAVLREVAFKQTGPGISPTIVTKSEVVDEQELEGFLNSNAPGPGGVSTGAAPAQGNSPSGAGWNNPAVPISATTAVADAFANYRGFKENNRARMTLEAIADIARYLSGIPGRKNLVWFAGDFPVVILPKFDQRQEAADNGIALSEIRRAANLLTTARVAVYPVYADGILSDDVVSADNRGPASANGVGKFPAGSGLGGYTAANSDRATEIAAMNQIASDTGGKAIYNTNDLDAAIGHSIADGAHYYSIVYTPENKKMDGRYRSIEVKVDGKYKLAYRRGYSADEDAKAPQQAETDPLRSLLRPGSPNATQLLFGVRAVPASPQPASGAHPAGKNASLSGPTTRYTVNLMIRWNDVALALDPNGNRNGKLQIELLAFDHNGKALNWNGGTEEMKLTPELFAHIQRSGIPAQFDIDLPRVPVYLEVGVHDLTNGKIGTLRIPLNPADSNVIASAK
ncbi:VWA domain-containing protein [Occallatibacter savannae]|uniref:VWA domain-containing protein n=1 Tax=Occallatibacter savannae TaxID=1002691 RepID=UPI0013A56568|nr:VWA domain-containing protein [Occallatibacter savannae]